MSDQGLSSSGKTPINQAPKPEINPEHLHSEEVKKPIIPKLTTRPTQFIFALILTMFGALPLYLTLLIPNGYVKPEVLQWGASTYVAMILAFLGGIHWGLAYARRSPVAMYITGIMLVLLPFFTVMLLNHHLGWPLLSALLVWVLAALVIDLIYCRQGLYPVSLAFVRIVGSVLLVGALVVVMIVLRGHT